MKKLSTNKMAGLVACLMTVAMAAPVFGDTLILRNGQTSTGTLTSADVNSITFRDGRGSMHRYSVNDVESVQFGDAPYGSQNGRQGYDRRDNDRNGAYD